MLGLFTIVGTAIEASWGGFYGNRSDFFLCKAFEKIRERIPPQTEPPNHLLQRALRKSYLEATLLIINTRIREIQPEGWKRLSQSFVKPDSSNQSGLSIWAEKIWEQLSPKDENSKNELLWLINVKDSLTKERSNVDKTNYPLKVSTEYELFMSPRGETVKNRVAEMREKMEDELLEELERTTKFGINLNSSEGVPPRIAEMIKEGWFPYQPNRVYRSNDEKTFWFDCFCGFFQQKLSGAVGDVFQNRLLTNLIIGKDVPTELKGGEDSVKSLTFDVFKDELKTFGDKIFDRFDQVDLRFDAVDETFEEVKNLLLEVLEILKNKQPVLPNSISQSVGFVGREDYLQKIREQYKKGCRIFAFHGIGGVGKTALALEFANEIKDQYQAKVFIDMQGLTNPLSARDAMFEIVVREFEQEIPADVSDSQLQNIFVSKVQNQPTLLVLDNAKDENSVESLINADNACFIITSRRRMYLNSEPFEILKMSEKDAVDLLLDKGGDNRIGEFVGDIAKECGYLPLALKVIKGLLMTKRMLRVDDFIDKFKKEKLHYLDEVTASLNLSYKIIGSELQARWRQLAVFPADFDAAACSAIWKVDIETAESTLEELVDSYSLIEVNLETRRFNLHDLARVFCNSKLSDDERFDIQFLFAKYYTSVLWTARNIKESDLQNGFINALRLIDTELSNIRTGQKWSAENLDENNEIAGLCRDYSGTFRDIVLRLHPREDIIWLQAGLKACQKIGNRQGEGISLGNLGLAYYSLGEYRKAIEYHEQSLEIKREIGDRQGEGASLGNLGIAYYSLGEYRKAIEYHEQSLEISREIGNRQGEGISLGNLGNAYKSLGEKEKACGLWKEALTIFEAIESPTANVFRKSLEENCS